MNPYDNFSYINLDRWASYWHQIKAVRDLGPGRVLEVGVGNKTVYTQLKLSGLDVTGLDIDPSLEPDVVSSVEKMPFKDESFDAVLCAEVLEHLPFSSFESSLTELSRVSRRHVVLTLPHWGRHFSYDFRLPLIRRIRGYVKVSFPRKEQHANSPHKWEIGKKGTSMATVRRTIEKSGLVIKSDYVLFEMPYHHMFILRKNHG